jgi:hypothetical protein
MLRIAQIAEFTKELTTAKAIERDWKVVSRKEEEDDYMDGFPSQ